jgi:RNA polymerase sigma-70 factor (ECF subfamily)
MTATVFLVAWRRFDELRRTDRPLAWLYGVARLTVANHHRSNRTGQTGARRR